MILGSAILAVGLFLLVLSGRIGYDRIRAMARRRRNHCMACDYPLNGLSLCPECGTSMLPHTLISIRQKSYSSALIGGLGTLIIALAVLKHPSWLLTYIPTFVLVDIAGNGDGSGSLSEIAFVELIKRARNRNHDTSDLTAAVIKRMSARAEIGTLVRVSYGTDRSIVNVCLESAQSYLVDEPLIVHVNFCNGEGVFSEPLARLSKQDTMPLLREMSGAAAKIPPACATDLEHLSLRLTLYNSNSGRAVFEVTCCALIENGDQ